MQRRLLSRAAVAGLASVVGVAAMAASPSRAVAQWSTTYESFYLPGKFNWQFRENYPAADRLFNAFDYGHAILYETLWTAPNAPVSRLEDKEYDFITEQLLVSPPNVPLEEAAIEVEYAKLAPEAKAMFDWAHLLHRQIYDVWADERIPFAGKDAKVAELVRYYKTRPELAFSSHPKTMELMEGQPYSLAFRKHYPKFNGLIWAYHWLQVGLYEPLVVGKTKDERQTGVLAAVARFRQMIENPPTNMPRIMPMTAAVSPTFAARYPEAAIIFDNLHSMHDVVSDILANPNVPRGEKRARILEAARRYRDATSYVETPAAWREMASMMGVENMGGPSVGFLAAFPTPTVERGAVMAGMDHSTMNVAADSAGVRGADHSKMPGMDHSKMSHDSAGMRDMDHRAMDVPPMPGVAKDSTQDSAMRDSMPGMSHGTSHDHAGAETGDVRTMMQLHERMMADPVIRRRVMADTAMRRMMREVMGETPDTSSSPGAVPAKRSAAKARRTTRSGARTPTRTPAPKPTARDSMSTMPGMDHGKMPGMSKPKKP